jgi:hypothetical protein
MAKQESLLKFSGKLGNVIGYRSKKNYLLRSASAVVKQTHATKKAAKDFGTASKAGRLIRHALSEHLQHCYDSSLTNRLNKKLGEIVRADDTHKPGMRLPLAANMQSLSNFQFNSKASMLQLLKGVPVIENNDGNISISFPEKINNKIPVAIKAIALSVNFTQQTTRQLASETIIIKCGEKQSVPTLTLSPGTNDLTFIMLEIQSCYEVNNQLFPCLNKKGAVLDIIAVLPPLEEKQAESTKLKYNNTAPVLRIIPSYIQPARLSRKTYCSLPEG